MREELAEIHPRVKVIEDESWLPRQQRYRPRDAQFDRYPCIVKFCRGLEVGRRRSFRWVKPAGEDTRLCRSAVAVGQPQHVAIPAVVVGTSARRVNSVRLDLRSVFAELRHFG